MITRFVLRYGLYSSLLTHGFADRTSENSVAKDATEEDSVNGPVARRIITVFGNNYDGEKHEGEAIIDRTQAADKADRVGVSNKEGERVASLG